MGYADAIRAFDAPQSDPGGDVVARLAQALRERGPDEGVNPLESVMRRRGQYFPALAAMSGMTQAPPERGERALWDYEQRSPNELGQMRHREMVRPSAGREDFPMEHLANMASAGLMLTPAAYALAPEMAAGRAVALGAQHAPRLTTAALAGGAAMAPSATAGAEDTQAVKDLQIKLRDAGYYRGEIDGKMGGGTQRAQQEFNAAEKARLEAENAARQTQAQQEGAAAAREAAQAQRAAAEAQQRETERRAAEDIAKAQQREQGNKRLTEMENEVPWYSRALRDYGGMIGYGVGAIAGPTARNYVVRTSDAAAKRAAEKAEGLYLDKAGQPIKVSATSGRVARANQFWREGGAKGDVPFTPTPGTAPGFAHNPSVKSIDELYQPNSVKDLLTDFGVAGAFGLEGGATAYLGHEADKDLQRATEAANADPSEINIRALQNAKDKVAGYELASNIGRAGAGSYLGWMAKVKRSPSVPSGAAAEKERLDLEAILRRKAPASTSKPQGSSPQSGNQVGVPPASSGPAAWKARQRKAHAAEPSEP
jgi:hypothetical protein